MTRQQRAEPPDNPARRDQPPARPTVAEVAKDGRREKITEHERRADCAGLLVTEPELLLERGQHRGEELGIEVIEQVQPSQHRERGKRPGGFILVHATRTNPPARTLQSGKQKKPGARPSKTLGDIRPAAKIAPTTEVQNRIVMPARKPFWLPKLTFVA